MQRTFLALFAVAALFGAGCGDDKEDSKSSDSGDATPTATPTATQPPLTKAEFIVKADDICRANKKATKQYDDRADALEGDDYKGFAEVLEDGIPALREGDERLRALPSPAEDKATLDAYYAARDKTLDVLDELVDIAKTGDKGEVEKFLTKNGDITDDAERLAKKYGFKACADD